MDQDRHVSPHGSTNHAAPTTNQTSTGNTYDERYLDLLRDVTSNGRHRNDRTGTGCRSVWGREIRHDLADGLPVLTTKHVPLKAVISELLWFISGDTNIRTLVREGVSIWTDWPLERYRRETGDDVDRATFERRIADDAAFAVKWGDLGPIYGKQWRSWIGADGRVHDQLAAVERKLRERPDDRRNVMTAWNVGEIERMALPPCHHTHQFTVLDGRVHAFLYQRSCDLFLGVPFNILNLALLTHMLAAVTGREAGEIVWYGADVHLYENHIDATEEQLRRHPGPLPELHLDRVPNTIDGFRADDTRIVGYDPHPAIRVPIAV